MFALMPEEVVLDFSMQIVSLLLLCGSCVPNLHEGKDEADGEVGQPVDRAGHHECCRPGGLPEHLGGHHVGDWTCKRTDVVNY